MKFVQMKTFLEKTKDQIVPLVTWLPCREEVQEDGPAAPHIDNLSTK